MTLIERTRAGFIEAFGEPPEGVVFAPGRVNLIGEHVDYNDGLVLPMPISLGTAVAWSSASGPETEAVALDLDFAVDRFAPGAVTPHHPADWRSYLRGMAACLGARGAMPGAARLAIAGSIPRGAGLSSSASLCVAIGRALTAAGGQAVPSPRELALAAQAAEHHWAGVKCGIMDQLAIAAGEPGQALLLDCRSLAVQPVPLPNDWVVAIIQSGVTRGLVDGHYNARRRECEAAAAALDLDSLRDATADMVEVADLEPLIRLRASHVVHEIARTRAAVEAIAAADLAALGDLLRASHASLRDLFEVSVPEVDAVVDLVNAAIGCEGGARMTGGGFGGAVVAVLERARLPQLRAELEREFATSSRTPLAMMIEGADGMSVGVAE